MRYIGSLNRPWEDECLFWRIYVPESMYNNVISCFHDDNLSCHVGIRKTYAKLEQRVYWKGMRYSVQNYIRHCQTCQESKSARLPPVPASGFTSNSPFDLLTVDIMGPYTKGRKQSTHILLCVDNFTRYIEIFPLRKTNAETILSKLWEVCCRWGLPRYILSDNGTQFTSKVYTDWCNSLGIQPYYISAYHPQANMTERYCQTVKNLIICMASKCKDWDCNLNEIAFAIRSCRHTSTGMSPAYANLGRELRTPFDNLYQVELSKFNTVQEIAKKLITVHNVVKEESEKNQTLNLKYYDRKAKPRVFKTGDLVWIKSHFLSDSSRGITASLTKKREGPFRVSSLVSEKVYNLVCDKSGAKVNKVHINEMSPYFQPLDQNEQQSNASSQAPPPEPMERSQHSSILPPIHATPNDGINVQLPVSTTEETTDTTAACTDPETNGFPQIWGSSC